MYFATTVIQGQWWVRVSRKPIWRAAAFGSPRPSRRPPGTPSRSREPKWPDPGAAAADEADVHRSPEPGDLPEPPVGRLLGGTGGPVIAKVPDRELRHPVHPTGGRILLERCERPAQRSVTEWPPRWTGVLKKMGLQLLCSPPSRSGGAGHKVHRALFPQPVATVAGVIAARARMLKGAGRRGPSRSRLPRSNAPTRS